MFKPLISVIVCTHLPENRKYLDACLKSLEIQEGVNFEVLLMSSAPHPEGINPHIRHVHCEGDLGWTKKIIKGAELADPASKYLMLLNDDVILSKHALATMAENIGPYAAIANPMSNCDNGWLYHARFELQVSGQTRRLEKRFYEFEELDGCHEAIHNFPKGNQRMYISAPHVCFYATMIPKSVWNQLGGVDPNFVNGYEDQDFCLRANKAGINSVVDAQAFIFHFGGATSEIVVTEPEKIANKAYFDSKWGVECSTV